MDKRHLRTALTCGLAFWLASAPQSSHADAELQNAIRARDDRIEDLESKVDTLARELSRMRERVAIPEEKELKSAYGLGPAASKVYGLERGLSIGGYGEAFYTHFVGDSGSGSTSVGGTSVANQALDVSDALRFVLYFGYKFTESIVFNAEIEFEHASTSSTRSSGGGSVSVEFAALDFFFKDWLNARAGTLLLPMGFRNEIHEPPFFHGVKRSEVETRIIPSTWRENGVGIFGNLNERLQYRLYAVTGFNARGFSSSGVRGGRQRGNRAFAEDIALVGRLDWTPMDEVLLGSSFYIGDSGQDQRVAGIEIPDARLWMSEVHAQYRSGPFELRALAAYSQLSDARDLTTALGLSSPIAQKMLGGYVEAAYDIWSLLFGNSERSLSPFARIEYVDTQFEVPSGFTADRSKSYWLWTTGLGYKPHPNVVLKLEYRNFSPRSGEKPDELNAGIGYAF